MESENPPIEKFCEVKKRLSTDIEAPKSRNIQTGVEAILTMKAIQNYSYENIKINCCPPLELTTTGIVTIFSNLDFCLSYFIFAKKSGHHSQFRSHFRGFLPLLKKR